MLNASYISDTTWVTAIRTNVRAEGMKSRYMVGPFPFGLEVAFLKLKKGGHCYMAALVSKTLHFGRRYVSEFVE
jgi:hypothetical protein